MGFFGPIWVGPLSVRSSPGSFPQSAKHTFLSTLLPLSWPGRSAGYKGGSRPFSRQGAQLRLKDSNLKGAQLRPQSTNPKGAQLKPKSSNLEDLNPPTFMFCYVTAAPDTFFLILCCLFRGPAGLPDIRVDLGALAAKVPNSDPRTPT